MPRDPDGKPIETRGRRSVSQRSRDLAEKLRSYGSIFESSPRLLESLMTGAFVASLVFFLRPRITATESSSPTDPFFRGKRVSQIQIDYPDLAWAGNLAILSALIVAPNIGGDVGSLIAPAATAGIFKTFIDKSFEIESFSAYDLAFGPYGVKPGGPGVKGEIDATMIFYLKVIFPRYVRALFVAAFFYIILRYVRNIGRN